MANKLDLFATIAKLDRKDVGLYDSLSEEERKQLHPLVIMRWLTGTNDPVKISLLNEYVNPYVFSLTKHKQLLTQLLSVCTDGRSTRYKWIKANTRTSEKNPKCLAIVKQYYNYSTKHARDALMLIDNDTIMQHALDLGTQPDELKKLKKELKGRVNV